MCRCDFSFVIGVAPITLAPYPDPTNQAGQPGFYQAKGFHMSITYWREGAGQMALCPRWQAPYVSWGRCRQENETSEWEIVGIRGTEQIFRMLGIGEGLISEMRRRLSCEEGEDVSRLTRQEILSNVVSKVNSGQWVLFRQERRSSDTATTARRTVAQDQRAASAAVTPSTFRAHQEERVIHPPERKANEIDRPSPHHDGQASTLRAAAKSGVPFCQVCDWLKANKAALHPRQTPKE